jgi:adenosyl cobinamide kinase/adenosyl cobinamide phosphate guanylyltransferase
MKEGDDRAKFGRSIREMEKRNVEIWDVEHEKRSVFEKVEVNRKVSLITCFEDVVNNRLFREITLLPANNDFISLFW